jgi:hypothetical protein
MNAMNRWMALSLLTGMGCSGDKNSDDTSSADVGWRPALVCPGDVGCESNEGALMAGAARRDITPTCFESWEDVDGDGWYDKSEESFFDCGCDRVCPEDEGWTAADEGEADGEFQAIWIAGFGDGRPASGVHDELWSRVVAVESGDTTVALVSLDLVGWFFDDTELVREAVAARGVDVDLVMVHATHSHEGPDTLGQWGERVGKRGVDDGYMALVIEQTADAVEEAVAGLQEAQLTVGAIDTAAPFGDKGTRNTVRDSRDPVVIDEMLYTAHFTATDGSSIATVVNWGNHPEALWSRNTELTSDYAHYMRDAIEDGVHYDSYSVEGLGGTAVYINASVGGLMTPGGITVTDGEGAEFYDHSFEKAEALGKVIAELALESVAAGSVASDATVSLRAAPLYIPIENIAFQAMFLIGVFDREIFNYDAERNLDENNTPDLYTEMNLIDIGPIRMMTVPGELFPELAIGGYDGSRVNTTEVELIDVENPNPPALDEAPEGPYLKDQMAAQYNWIIGLGNDEIGYLIPSYDYKLHELNPYLDEPEGDHYEETNSVGPSATPRILDMATQLIEWTP